MKAFDEPNRKTIRQAGLILLFTEKRFRERNQTSTGKPVS
jgi:hypothetical protein